MNREMNLQQTLLKSENLRMSLLMIVIGIFIGFLAPFGMHTFSPMVLIPYWAVTCLMGYWVFSPVYDVVVRKLENQIPSIWLRRGLSLLVSTTLFSLLLPLWNMLTLSSSFNYLDGVAFAFPNVLVIGLALTLISVAKRNYFEQRQRLQNIDHHNTLAAEEKVIQTLAEKQLDDFLKLLPIEKQGRLICLEMDDHYLKVHTSNGQHMLLMRFKDALDRLSAYPGLQTHRSWWVAEEAISKIEKQGRKRMIHLSNNLQVPVSKTFENQLKTRQIK